MHDASQDTRKRNEMAEPSRTRAKASLGIHPCACLPAWLTYRPLGVGHERERDEVLSPQRLPRHGALRPLVRLLVGVGHRCTYVWLYQPWGGEGTTDPTPVGWPLSGPHHTKPTPPITSTPPTYRPWRRPCFWSRAGTRAARRRCASAAAAAPPGPSGPPSTAPVR